MKEYDYAVIGAGLFGSSAAKYLSQSGSTLVFAPAEPADYAQHEGVFASHYDSGRSIRIGCENIIEAKLAKRGLERYRAIEAASHTHFYEAVGSVLWKDAEALDKSYQATQELGATAHRIPAADVPKHFPFVGVFDGYEAIYEEVPAGYISPRILKQAQLRIAQQHGATILESEVLELDPQANNIRIHSQHGDFYAKKVLIATGAYAVENDALCLPNLDFRVKTESIMLAKISEAQAQSFAGMPPLLYGGAVGDLNNFYLLPPIRYPDGNIYLKIGADTSTDTWLSSRAEIQEWMKNGDNSHQIADFSEAIRQNLPSVQIEYTEMKRCIVAYTPHHNPYIDALRDGQLYLATGGNGYGATMAEATGELAAQLVINNRWIDTELNQDDFRIVTTS